MANFSVDPTILNQKAANLNEHADEYNSISAKLQSAATTMGAAYDSADNRSFVARMEACAKELKAMADKLRAAAATLSSQATIYTEQENSNTQKANQLPG